MSRALEDFRATKGETETQHRCAGSGRSANSKGHWEGDFRKQQGQLIWTGLDWTGRVSSSLSLFAARRAAHCVVCTAFLHDLVPR